MELRHLRYFVAVAEEQNITRAAARLHVSQPPLSRQIRDLEEAVGTPLLERTARAVRLTPAGWAFLEGCYAVLRQADDAVRAAKAAASGAKGELQLGYAPGPTQEMLRELLRELRRVEPGLRVVLHDLSTAEMLHGLREGKLDAALMVDPGKQGARGLVFTKLREDEPMVLVAADHALARRRTVEVTELARQPLVVFSRAEYPEYHVGLAALLGKNAGRMKIAEECDSGASMFAAVEAGSGVAVVSRSLAAAVGERLRLIAIRPMPAPTVVGVAHLATTRNRLVLRLVDVARALAGGKARPRVVNAGRLNEARGQG